MVKVPFSPLTPSNEFVTRSDSNLKSVADSDAEAAVKRCKDNLSLHFLFADLPPPKLTLAF